MVLWRRRRSNRPSKLELSAMIAWVDASSSVTRGCDGEEDELRVHAAGREMEGGIG